MECLKLFHTSILFIYVFCINIFSREPLNHVCVSSVCPVGGASDRIQGHHWKGVSAQGHHQHTRSQPFQQTHRPGAGGVSQGSGAEAERDRRYSQDEAAKS